eukprot:TRINITY_DN9609_c2_g1_i1.p1 TRINITY_DN9609_c2_g1~~TRINITY_DN9609_c2_g1_i1.p1  ORF type:complete len:587 (-),score=107.37 TRINITY_DN9609_c2_g1_i1:209-1969(-)
MATTKICGLVLLSAASLPLVVEGGRQSGMLQMEMLSLYHLGNPAVHVTRLHRYEHAGMQAMLEAEAKWHSKDALESSFLARFKSSGSSAILAKEGVSDRSSSLHRAFVRVSAEQASALRRHHETTGLLQLDGRQQASANEYSGAFGTLQYHDFQRPTSSHPAVTGMANLGSQYIGPLGVGTQLVPQKCEVNSTASLLYVGPSDAPAQKDGSTCHVTDESQVWVVFDTGSTNIWVNSVLCKEGACAQPGRHRYNFHKSRTFKSGDKGSYLHIEFGTGTISGPRVTDDFHIGPFSIYNQTFGMMEKTDGQVFYEVPLDGILGLAFPAMSADGAVPFFDTVIKEKALANNEFAFYFSLDSTAANAAFWGGVDPVFYDGPIEYFNVVEPYYWSLHLVSFKIGQDEIIHLLNEPDDHHHHGDDEPAAPPSPEEPKRKNNAGNVQYKAIIDTGTTFFTAQGKAYPEVLRRLPPAPCDRITYETHPNVTITLESSSGEPRDFVLTHKQYMPSSDDQQCAPAWMKIQVPEKHGPGMVLGEVFLRHYFAVFNRGDSTDAQARVGIAPARHGPDVERRLKELTKNQPAFRPPNDSS